MKVVRVRMWVNGRLVWVPMWLNTDGERGAVSPSCAATDQQEKRDA